MVDYARSDLGLSYGQTSSLQSPQVAETWTSVPAGPSKYLLTRVTAVITTGTTITLSGYTTLEELYIRNLDATNFVSGTFKTAASGSSNACKIKAGQWLKLLDMTVATALVLTADTANVVCEIFAVGT